MDELYDLKFAIAKKLYPNWDTAMLLGGFGRRFARDHKDSDIAEGRRTVSNLAAMLRRGGYRKMKRK